ncbi:phosphoribosyltransferase family protein [Bacillus sp. CLL-7-23]|uniref:Phosphoribosyltransferase family protein n=1 Tax=Bacillus changyiensis TaxID=3004103 RepID=A0ABT4X3T4_9BACI|nr:phosphoribosyltransferase family protein [Bacillus changyiensis]MDA7026414.1 phosphoribosyltransferase family protein [Bacillus changyiensis]
MKTGATLTYSQQKKKHFQILDHMEVDLLIDDNPLSIPPEKLFAMAARVNKKRGFLFVSKVLGKHIPVNPLKPLLASGLLAIEHAERTNGIAGDVKSTVIAGFLAEDVESMEKAYTLLRKQRLKLSKPPIVIGFAETATALGQGVFDLLEGATYIHTTRESPENLNPVLTFEEEHSHAVDQRCYTAEEVLTKDRPIILVDDEITTGKTVLNIIRDIQQKYPRKEYAVLSLLDWRSLDHKKDFQKVEDELGVTISTTALLSGSVTFTGQTLDQTSYHYEPVETEMNSSIRQIDLSEYFTKLSNQKEFVKETGRFGIDDHDKRTIELACQKAGRHLNSLRKGKRILCLGTGEFMYLPMKIATFMGDNVFYQSTTRSPIHPVDRTQYAVKNGYSFPNPENQNVKHFIYNLPEQGYDEVFLFVEKPVIDKSLQPFLKICSDRKIEQVTIVTFS